MSPIQYIEARCDRCNEEINSGWEDVEFGILRSGQLVCATCRDKRPDHEHFKNFSVATPEPEEEPDLIPTDDRQPKGKFEMYYCSKCDKRHFRTSKTGREHADFEAEEPEDND